MTGAFMVKDALDFQSRRWHADEGRVCAVGLFLAAIQG
jgi:hypothetical protein